MQNFENEVKGQSRNLDRNAIGQYSIYLGPSQHDLVTMITDIVKRLQWSNLAFITHRETGKKYQEHVLLSSENGEILIVRDIANVN